MIRIYYVRINLFSIKMYKRLLTGVRDTGLTYRDINCPKAPIIGDGLQKMETWCSLHSLQGARHLDRLESVLSKWLSWSEPLLGSSAGLQVPLCTLGKEGGGAW